MNIKKKYDLIRESNDIFLEDFSLHYDNGIIRQLKIMALSSQIVIPLKSVFGNIIEKILRYSLLR